MGIKVPASIGVRLAISDLHEFRVSSAKFLYSNILIVLMFKSVYVSLSITSVAWRVQ
jgi:hypothetical protein